MFLSNGTASVNLWLSWIMCDLSWNVRPYWAVFIASFNGDEPPMSTAGFCWISLKMIHDIQYHTTVYPYDCCEWNKHINYRSLWIPVSQWSKYSVLHWEQAPGKEPGKSKASGQVQKWRIQRPKWLGWDGPRLCFWCSYPPLLISLLQISQPGN